MDLPDKHVPQHDTGNPDEVSLYDVMAATQRYMAQNLVDIATAGAALESNMLRVQEESDLATIKKDAALLLVQSETQKAEYYRTHDSKTGLPNKLYLTEIITTRLGNDETVGLFALDITHFKENINDSLGHEAGDRFLKSWGIFATTKFARSKDIVASEPEIEGNEMARTGGDEFFVISNLNGIRNDSLEERAASPETRIHKEYEYIHTVFDEFIASSEWAGINVTVAVGYALRLPGDNRSADELFEIADANMYDEKEAQHAAKGTKPR